MKLRIVKRTIKLYPRHGIHVLQDFWYVQRLGRWLGIFGSVKWRDLVVCASLGEAKSFVEVETADHCDKDEVVFETP